MDYLHPILLETLKIFLSEQRHDVNRTYVQQSVAQSEAEVVALQREINRRLLNIKTLEALIQELTHESL